MKYIITPILGLLLTLVSFVVAPIGMLFVRWMIVWDIVPTSAVTRWSTGPGDPNSTELVIRGHFKPWCTWFGVPDDLPPGNMYVPEVLAMLHSRGPLWTSYVFYGWRNQMMNLACAFGIPANGYIPDVPATFWSCGNVWRLALPLGPIKLIMGHQVYRNMDGTFVAAPVFTVKKA